MQHRGFVAQVTQAFLHRSSLSKVDKAYVIHFTQANEDEERIRVTTVSESRTNGRTAAAATSPAIEMTAATKRFRTPDGSSYTALNNLDLRVERGEFCAIVGPTGCGKSTSLTLAAGMEKASEGSVRVFGKEVDGITPNAGFMFQTDAILPWQSVLENVAAGPRYRGVQKNSAYRDARDWIRRVGLAGFENNYPHQLSGGMRKRVALAQNLINEPELLLMDEPFSALDVQTRAKMSTELLTLWEQSKPAVVFVTHDLEEAIALADKVV
ncbi:ABC transporter ATP-binding protein, partial [Arthrobacter sp. 2YAF22_2]|uniref:ABC transporter ATP-binding protein n=1 Tax=Arthrobacter sp. 2YAF22_2 TaxID=3233029 RepID=UPI003F912C1B